MSENPIVRLRREAETRIRKKRDLTKHLRLIWINKPEEYTFKPGQYCTYLSWTLTRSLPRQIGADNQAINESLRR